MTAPTVTAEPTQVTTWSGLLAPIDKPTGDKRRFAVGALSNRDLPLPLLWQTETDEGHKKSVVVGRILEIDHQPKGSYGRGDFFDPTLFPAAAQAIEQVRGGVIGPSVDLDDLQYEYRLADGTPYDETMHVDLAPGEQPPSPEFVVTAGRISGATLVAIPAFNEAKLTLDTVPGEGQRFRELMTEMEEVLRQSAGLTASAAAAGPPLAAFANPELAGPTPITVTDDGRVFGHLATWESCHVGFPGTCVTPPQSATDYAFFHTGEVVAADGTRVPVGRIVVGTKHATLAAGFRAASQHYDDTGRVAALVRAGADEHGIWLAGVESPDADASLRAELRANPLSGDWRRVGGAMELIGAVAVPVPGFPIARATAPGVKAALEPQALVAAGMLAPEAPTEGAGMVDLDTITAAVRDQLRREVVAERLLAELSAERASLLGGRRDAVLAEITAGRE